ncbi:MAG: hypothetical protein E6I95_14725 [Chloroflexi bacterium]|nr:MAG: hypothetical protein E6I95_14725 [Chloroflexota bacterium]
MSTTAFHERWMLEVEVAGGSQKHQPRLEAEAEALSQLGEFAREVGKHVRRGPDVPRRRAHGAGADDDSVGACAQQRHQESVPSMFPAEHRAR